MTSCEAVLDPFTRAEHSRNRDTGGSGLGLAIAKAVAVGHGGDLVSAQPPGRRVDRRLVGPAGALEPAVRPIQFATVFAPSGTFWRHPHCISCAATDGATKCKEHVMRKLILTLVAASATVAAVPASAQIWQIQPRVQTANPQRHQPTSEPDPSRRPAPHDLPARSGQPASPGGQHAASRWRSIIAMVEPPGSDCAGKPDQSGAAEFAAGAARLGRSPRIIELATRGESNFHLTERSTNESGGVFRRRRSVSTVRLSLELVRNVVEGRAKLGADALHRGNRGNGDEGGNQAVFNRGRTLVYHESF